MYSRCRNFFSAYGRKIVLGGSAVAPVVYLTTTAVASDLLCATPPHYHWEHREWNKFFDVAAMRRGYQVYKEVCSSCHAVRFLCFRHLVGVIFTEKQAKAEAQSALVEDGPDEEGELFLRPGTLQDVYPPPYKNDLAARAANNGALPPDLSLIVGARHHGPDYFFSLLTGYEDEEIPPGLEIASYQAYNPFFEGGAISMPPPLQDGAVSYPDGTPATVSQMAKDLTEFFGWMYWRNMDMSKQVGMLTMIYGFTASFFFYWVTRYSKVPYLTQRLSYKNRPWGHIQ